MVSMLTRMLLRDLWHLRGQIMAAALVVACGIGALVATRGTYQSLLVARADYYAANRFADVFARLKRAPDSLAEDIRRVSGVAQVRTRIVVEVTLDVPGLAEPAIGRVVSIPERRAPMLNDLQLVRGHYVAPGSTDQVSGQRSLCHGQQARRRRQDRRRAEWPLEGTRDRRHRAVP